MKITTMAIKELNEEEIGDDVKGRRKNTNRERCFSFVDNKNRTLKVIKNLTSSAILDETRKLTINIVRAMTLRRGVRRNKIKSDMFHSPNSTNNGIVVKPPRFHSSSDTEPSPS